MSWESFGCCCSATLCCPTTSVLWRCSGNPVIEFPSGGNYLTANGATQTSVTLAPAIFSDQTLTRINGPFQRCSYRKVGLQTVGNPVVGGSLWVTFNGVSRPTAAYLPWWYVQAVSVKYPDNVNGVFYTFWEAAVSLKLYYGTGFPNVTYIQHGSITLGRTTAIPSTGCPMNLLYRRGNPSPYPWFGEITSGGILNTQTPNAPYHDPGPAGSTVEYATPASSFQVSIV